MNKSKSYFVVKNPDKKEIPLTENELINNLNPLLQTGRIIAAPIEKFIGKDFTYKDVQSSLEVEGVLNIMQIVK